MTHIHNSIDFIVNAFIVYKDKVLLIHHKKLDKWLPIGGHIELDENPEDALFREVKEECGLKIEILNRRPKREFKEIKFLYAPNFLDFYSISKTHKHVGLVYFAKTKSDKYVFNSREHKAIRWFNISDLDKSQFNLMPAVKFYVREALSMVDKQ